MQVSSTHQRLTVELTDMAESEQQQTEQQNTDVEGSGHDMQARAISTFQDHQSHKICRIGDFEMWILLWIRYYVHNL